MPCPSMVCRRGLGSGGEQLYRSTSGQVLVSAEVGRFRPNDFPQLIVPIWDGSKPRL